MVLSGFGLEVPLCPLKAEPQGLVFGPATRPEVRRPQFKSVATPSTPPHAPLPSCAKQAKMAIKSEIVGRIGGFKAIKLNDGRNNERRPLRRRMSVVGSGGDQRVRTGSSVPLGQTGKGVKSGQCRNWLGGSGGVLDVQEVTCVPVTHTGFVSRPCKVTGLPGGCGWAERR